MLQIVAQSIEEIASKERSHPILGTGGARDEL